MIETSEAIETIDLANSEAFDMVRANPSETLLMSKESLARAEEIGYQRGIGWALGNIGAAHTWLSNYEEALNFCFKSIENLLEADDFKQASQIEYYVSIIFYYLGDYEKQMTHSQSSYDLAEKCDDVLGMANALNGVGTGQYTNGQNEDAVETLSKALDLSREIADNALLGRIYDGIGQAYFHMEEFEKALEYKEKALELVKKTGVKQTESYALDGIGEILAKTGNYAGALEKYQESFDVREKMGFKDGMAKTKIHMAEAYCLAGDNLNAVQEYKDALGIGAELDSKEIIYKSHFGLSELYEDMGNLTLFVKHFKAYHTALQEFSEEKENKKVRAFELKGRLDQIQKEKEELERKNLQLQSYFKDVQTLSSIGHQITSTHDIEDIFEIVYERINALMDATGIFIGICNYEENKLQVKLAIDHGKRDSYFEHSLDDRKIANYVVNTGKSVHINDYDNEIHEYFADGEQILHNTADSVVVIPLTVKDNTIGVLYAQSGTRHAFSRHHFNILKSFASYLAIALDNAWLYEQMDAKVKHRTDELETTYKNSELLNKIGQELISSLDFEDVFERLYKNVNRLMDATIFGVRLLDRENHKIIYPYEYEKGKRLDYMEDTLDNKNNYSVWCVDHRKEIHINNNDIDYKEYVEEVHVIDGDFPYSLIFYPLISEGETIGVISVQSFERNAYTPYHLTIVKTLAQYTTLALQNARRYEIMEEAVRERTSEITKTYENTKLLSEIGKNITAQLSVEAIIKIAYDTINEVMDAEGFGIGIYMESTNELDFPGYIESGEQLQGARYSVDAPNRMACICFNNDQEIVVNNFEQEYSKWIDKYVAPVQGKTVSSLIYLPLKTKGKKIGVITVQSFNNNAYSDYEVNMLRNIGVYTAIAVDNATLVANMEDIVKERTSEVVQQKEEIERSFQNIRLISEINNAISKSITIESLIDNVYENCNAIMDATGFGIGVFEEDRQKIVMKGYIEKGEKLPQFEYDIKDERLAPWCFNNKKEIWISDYSKEYKNYVSSVQAPVSGKDSASIIYLPLFSKEKTVGLLTVQSFKVNAYSEYHMNVLRGLAATIAAAIENAILYESLEEKVKERTAEVVKQKEQIEKASENTKLLSELGKDIASELSSEGIISKVYKSINHMMDATGFGIGVYKPDNKCLYFAGAMENGVALPDFEYSVEEEKISTICFNQSKEIIINDWNEQYKDYLDQDYESIEGETPESMMYLPLITKEKVIGVITVQSFEKDVYEEYHVNILRTLSLYIASALENASLYKDMEDRVKERTAEIEKAYEATELLSKVSKTIVESLEIEGIIERVYDNINSLLDTTCFGIGIYDEKRNGIDMPGFIENGKQLDRVFIEFGEVKRLAHICIEENREILISDFFEEHHKYLDHFVEPVQGEHSRSIIYLPLHTTDKVIGLLTVQSYEPNQYTEYHLNLLRSLATTIATALDNAMLYENLEEKVEERTLELSEQKAIIEEKNKHITDSIRYAKRIQDATLPSIGLVRNYLPDSFVLFKPKDIVSGDFYWVETVEDTVLFAVVDCTGHGVPGAFLSLIGHNSLNQIVNELGINSPADILYELNKIVQVTLQNNIEHTNIKDGMDVAICSLNMKTKELTYAGAFNPLYYIRQEELLEIKGDKIAIGSALEDQLYTNHTLQLEEGDRIYIFSDGYADQFGGPKGKKFKYSQLKDLLVKIHQKPMEEQHKLLNHYIDAWQGDLEQLDDICLIGVSI